jgi:DNA polymerase III epsilon subunit-like protein|tara:strand:+ start:12013 stop:12729 length:717 start_codon:yes stop_codon:yes gene_type:complete
MSYIVIDFETNGIGVDKKNKYKPYPPDQMPLPRPNYPVELAFTVINADGIVVQSESSIIIRGATRLDPFVLENCPHLSVERCDAEGIDFMQAMEILANAAKGCTIVAHNMQYDWHDVIVCTMAERKRLDDVIPKVGGSAPKCCFEHFGYLDLQKCPRFCTCVNAITKKDKSAYYYKRIGRWIGPSLQNLALKYNVSYDTSQAHMASYDVSVTLDCLRIMKHIPIQDQQLMMNSLEQKK